MDDMSSMISFRVISRKSEGQVFFRMKIYGNRFFDICPLLLYGQNSWKDKKKMKQLKFSMNIL